MFKSKGFLFSAILVASLSISWSAEAKLEELPKCAGKDGKALPIDNSRVVALKATTPNQFLERARVEGRVVRILGSRPEHAHFEIQIGPNAKDTLEVVFNLDFGRPQPKVGDDVEACGDYITSNAPTPRYQPSPSGAIIHWVHENSRGGGHPDGYIVLNDRSMYGFGKQPIEVDGSEQPSNLPKAGTPSVPASSDKTAPAPAPAGEAKAGKPAKEEKKERRPSDGKDDPEFEKKPRHGRNWRDWVDADKN
jgi:hypothetical protein